MTIDRLRALWPVLAFLASAALLAGAHAFESFGGLRPCALCLDQREYHWAVLGVSAACFLLLRFRPGAARLTAVVIGLAFFAAAAMAAYHVAVEHHWIIAQCDADLDLNAIQNLGEGTFEAPRCDEVAWSMFGISMAGYNMLISAAQGLASFALALWPKQRLAHA